jgi:hypothetical protein
MKGKWNRKKDRHRDWKEGRKYGLGRIWIGGRKRI